MNIKISTLQIICILSLVTVFYACKKTAEDKPAIPTVSTEKVKISIRLSGDITITQVPMTGARMKSVNNYVFSKTVYDSTIYAIDVRMGNNQLYAAGMFDNANDIMLEVPKGATYMVKVAAIKKGTGDGLSWGIVSGGSPSGSYHYYNQPFNMALKNEMIYNAADTHSPDALDSSFLDKLDNMDVYNAFNSTSEQHYFSELDSYFGDAIFNAGDSAVTLNIPLKRISFGIKYNTVNFNEGKLIAEYNNLVKTKYILPGEENNSLGIYTGNNFRYLDTLYTNKVDLTLKWEKGDGSTQVLGTKTFSPIRNSLTTVNVTIPQTSAAKVEISLSDSTWRGVTSVDF